MTTTSPSEPQQPTPPTGRELLTKLLKVAHDYAAGKTKSPQVVRSLRAVADWLEGSKPITTVKTKAPDPRELRVFDFWRTRIGKPKAQLTAGRRAKIRARLAEGYTVEDCCRAIDGAADSKFHRGENETGTEYLDLTLILRNGEKLEGFRDQGGETSLASTGDDAGRGDKLAALLAKSARELKEGKTDAYNRTNAEIKALRAKAV